MNKFFQIIFSKTYFSSPLKKLNKQTKKNKGFTKNRIIRFHAFFQNFQFWNLFSKSFNDRKDHLFTEIKKKGPNRKKNIIKNPILNLKKNWEKILRPLLLGVLLTYFPGWIAPIRHSPFTSSCLGLSCFLIWPRPHQYKEILTHFRLNVPLMDKPGSWFLLAKYLKNTCGRVTF